MSSNTVAFNATRSLPLAIFCILPGVASFNDPNSSLGDSGGETKSVARRSRFVAPISGVRSGLRGDFLGLVLGLFGLWTGFFDLAIHPENRRVFGRFAFSLAP